ncbi:DNA adenine methylase [Helicobacter sp. 11S02629-2]|uniref:DNA adenine methylase n=1 Tax=Helicobacter sp. 11S02629-2 TaxID=1476195 RepID=UPI00215143A6|nr:DNA adenine methylase [Helicobacter sp. 11S02629-2]
MYGEVINDINSDLINLHTIIKTRPRAFKAKLEKMLCSREVFESIKRGFLVPKDSLEKAVYYYYIITFSFASKGKHFALNKNRKPKNIYKDYSKWSERLKNVTIENLDFKTLIPKYDTASTFFYVDPPYVGTENYYKTKTSFTRKEHIALADILKSIRGKFLLSYNDHPMVRELYSNFDIVESKEIRYTMNIKANKKTTELLIKNY